MVEKVIKSDDEWKQQLTPLQFRILRGKGTEFAFTGKFFDSKRKGTYACVACGNKLFSSEKEYDSGTGWPSFLEPISNEAVIISHPRDSSGVSEVLCAKCEGHLGNVFLGGSNPNGKWFCMNSSVLKFEKSDEPEVKVIAAQ